MPGSVLDGIDFYPTPSPGPTTDDPIVFYVDDVVFSEVGKQVRAQLWVNL